MEIGDMYNLYVRQMFKGRVVTTRALSS